MAAEESAAPQEKTGGSQRTRGAVSFGSAGAGEETLCHTQRDLVCIVRSIPFTPSE